MMNYKLKKIWRINEVSLSIEEDINELIKILKIDEFKLNMKKMMILI